MIHMGALCAMILSWHMAGIGPGIQPETWGPHSLEQRLDVVACGHPIHRAKGVRFVV